MDQINSEMFDLNVLIKPEIKNEFLDVTNEKVLTHDTINNYLD